MGNKITVVLVEPGKEARVVKVSRSLTKYQKVVGGLIQVIYPFGDQPICLVCNDEAKLDRLPYNRVICDYEAAEPRREVLDVIAGTFFLCDGSTSRFESLSAEQIELCMKHFRHPEVFISTGDKLVVIHRE